MARTSVDPHARIVPSKLAVFSSFWPGTATVLLLVLMLAASWVRGAGLPAVQGTMGRDEARLALAARGILAHGIPLLPGGFVYTRGLLPAYLEAVVFAILGISDQSARLPSLVFGTLLVPAVFRLARLAGSTGAAFAAACIVAFSPPLVLQSREAWLYSSFLFWLVMALGWLVRDAPGDRTRAGLAALAALFSHELAVLLIPVAGLLDLARLWRDVRRWRAAHLAGSGAVEHVSHPASIRASGLQADGAPDRRPIWNGRLRLDVLLFWALLLGGLVAIGLLGLELRAPTLGGATVEMREYLRPTFDLAGLSATLGILGGWHPWLLPAAALAIPFSRGGWRLLLAGRGLAPALLGMLAVVLFNSFGLVRRGESRYVLAALPFLAVVAAVALERVGPSIVASLSGLRLCGRTRWLVGSTLLVILVAASLDPARLSADAQARTVTSTWVQAMADRSQNDPIVSFAPTLTSEYLGRTDVWLRPDGYEKYVWAGQTPLRDVHTNAVVIRSAGELDRLLFEPYRGKTVWVVLTGAVNDESSRALRTIEEAIAARAVETRRSADGRVVLKLKL